MKKISPSQPPFDFSHKTESDADYFKERAFGAVPGVLSWVILVSLVVLSFAEPLYAAMVIIALDIYWFMRIFYMTVFLVLAYAVLAVEKETDWTLRCHLLEKGAAGLPVLEEKFRQLKNQPKRILRWFDLKNEKRELKGVIRDKVKIPAFDGIYHVVIIAAAKEGKEVLEPGLQAIAAGQFPAKRIVPILAIEERAGAAHTRMAEALREKYKSKFMDFLVAVHPDNLPGEARVKGANVTFAAKQAEKFFREAQIPFENIVVSCFDADTVASPQYFAALTYHFMRHPNRTRSSFQPIPVYHNNILEASPFARVLETGSSFFQMIEATDPEKLVTFSSHSMSFKALVEIDYWPVDMISDDSAIFWKALIHYGGDYRVVPMYVTLSMDVVIADTLWKTLSHIYRQKLRWAWGVENFPIVARAFLKETRMSLASRIRYMLKLLEMHLSWATLGFIITFIGWLPAMFAGREFSTSVFYYNSPRIAGLIFNLASLTFVISILLALALLPKDKAKKIPLLKRLVYAAEWLLVPVVFTFLSCLPALDAQTRLARGMNMKFWVSEKKRKRG